VKMCEAFADTGAQVELVTARRKNSISDNAFVYYGVKENFSLSRLPCIDLAPDQEPANPIFSRLRAFSFALSVLWHLWRKEKGLIYVRYDVALMFILPTFFNSSRIVCEAHFLLSGFQRRLLYRAGSIVVINKTAKDIYERDYKFKGKILVAPDGVAVRDFSVAMSRQEARGVLGLPFDKKLIIYTGYFYKWKGVDTLAEAARYFKSDEELVLVGGAAHDIARLKVKLNDFGVHNARFIGYRPYKEMPIYQKAADCLVLTGTATEESSNHFTSPLKMFEYMASGNPVVATATPAIKEVLTDGRNAVLVPPDDANALYLGISKVLVDMPLASRIARQAREDVAQYDWRERARRIGEFLGFGRETA